MPHISSQIRAPYVEDISSKRSRTNEGSYLADNNMGEIGGIFKKSGWAGGIEGGN
jgi:hypothetical protein